MTGHYISAYSDASKLLKCFFENQHNLDQLENACKIFIKCINSGRKIISCGNGGSMCDSMHFAEELSGKFRKDRSALPAISISDPSHISCVANDYGFEFVFSRYIEALGKKDDVLLAISTSGNSENIINACISAKSAGIKTVALLGKDGGKIKELVDIPIIVESNTSDRIQEIHIKLIHMFIEGIERELFPSNYK